jgi:hypothetical protein
MPEETTDQVAPSAQETKDAAIIATKNLRVQIDEAIQAARAVKGSREMSLVITNLQQAVMWAGMNLKELGTPNPYPNSRDATNTIVDPTAQGLKL